MGMTNELRAWRDRISEMSSKHAELFPQGHEGSAHCQCDMAKEIRAEQEKLEIERKKLHPVKPHTCPALSAELERKVRERIAEIRIELCSFVKGRTNNQVAILNHERDALNGVLREAGLEGKS